MSATKSKILFVSTVAAGLGLAAWMKYRRRDVPGLSAWMPALEQDYGFHHAADLAHSIRERYAALLENRPIPTNAALRSHLLDHILPGLALYQTLLAETRGDRPAAIAEVDRLFRVDTLIRSRRLMIPFRLVSDPFPLFRRAFRQIIKSYPPEGWDYTWLDDNTDRIAFNYSRCFYLDTLTSCGAPELTPSFCKTDEVMAELFPAGVRFIRTNTLARGGDCCDFQYCRSGLGSHPG